MEGQICRDGNCGRAPAQDFCNTKDPKASSATRQQSQFTITGARFERKLYSIFPPGHIPLFHNFHDSLELSTLHSLNLAKMQMPDMPVNVPVDDPNADTEW